MVALFLTHWWQFNYLPHDEAWYRGAVWPNVFVLAPLSILGVAGWIWHRGVMKETHQKLDRLTAAHNEHAKKLELVLDALDPETDGGIAVLSEHVNQVIDAVNPDTPGGISILEEHIGNKIDALTRKPNEFSGKAVE